MNKYNYNNSGKGHNKILHISKKYKENMTKDPDKCTHRFNAATNICIHCGMHRDELLRASGIIPNEF